MSIMHTLTVRLLWKVFDSSTPSCWKSEYHPHLTTSRQGPKSELWRIRGVKWGEAGRGSPVFCGLHILPSPQGLQRDCRRIQESCGVFNQSNRIHIVPCTRTFQSRTVLDRWLWSGQDQVLVRATPRMYSTVSFSRQIDSKPRLIPIP